MVSEFAYKIIVKNNYFKNHKIHRKIAFEDCFCLNYSKTKNKTGAIKINPRFEIDTKKPTKY